MALNRYLYPQKGTNIVQQGTMSQRWLLNDVATGIATAGGINTTTDEYGRVGNVTVGRGFTATLTGGSTGKIVVRLPQGASWANVVKASCDVVRYDPTTTVPASANHAYYCMTNRFLDPTATEGAGVEFVSYLLDTNPNVQDPPLSANNVAPVFTPGTYPNLASPLDINNVPRVPVVLTSGTTVKTGLTMSFTLTAPPSTIAVTAASSGTAYTIATLGNTNFVAMGASANQVGVTFIATGAGTGTGTVTTQAVATGSFDQSDAELRAALSGPIPGGSTTYTISLPANYGSVSAYDAATPPQPAAVVAPAAANIGTLAVTAPVPTYIAVNVEFTMSTVPA